MGLFNSYWRGAKVFGSAGTGGGGGAGGLPTAPPPGGGEVDFRAADISNEDAQELTNRANENAPLTRGSTGGADTFDPQLIARPKVVFDGVDDFLQTDHTPNAQQASGAFSAVVELSIDPSALPGSRIFSSETGSSNGALAFIDSAGRIAFRLRNGSGLYLATDRRDYADGVPFRFAVSVDSSTGESLLYTSRGDITTLSTLTVPTVTHAALQLFRAAFGGSSLAGTLYSFASYDTALTAAEAQSFVDPSEGWAARAQTTATAIFDMSTLVEGAQSVQNDAQANDDIAILGARRGEEVSSVGLEHPGLANNYAVLDTVLDMRGDAEIYYTFAGTWGTLNPVSLATFAISENGNTDASLRYSLAGPGLEFYWQGVDAVYHVPVSVAPSAAATGIGGSRTRQSATTHHVKFYQQLAGAWVQLGPTQTVTTAADVAPATLSYHIGGHPSLPARTFAHVTETVTFINDGVTLSSVDFRNAPARARSFPDEQGNTWSIVSTGVDTNDPLLLTAKDGTYIYVSPDTPAAGDVITVSAADLQLANASVTVLEYVTDERVAHGVLPAYLYYHSNNGRFYSIVQSGGVRQYFTRASNGDSYSAAVVDPDILLARGVRVRIDWNFNGLSRPRVTAFYQSAAGDPWVDAGNVDFHAEVLRPGVDSTSHVGGNGVNEQHAPAGKFRHLTITTDDVLVLSVQSRDAVEGGWATPTGNTATLSSSIARRIVTESQMLFDGVDDFLQLPASEAHPIGPGLSQTIYLRAKIETNTEFGRIYSSVKTAGGTEGLNIGVYTESHASAGRIYGSLLAAAGSAYSIPTDFTLAGAGEEVELLVTVDGAGIRLRAKKVSTGVVYDGGLATSMAGPITTLPPRIGGNAHSGTQNAELTLYDVKTWDRALTGAEIAALGF